jgi:hypothetical protein
VGFCVVVANRAVLRPVQIAALDQIITVRPDLASAVMVRPGSPVRAASTSPTVSA